MYGSYIYIGVSILTHPQVGNNPEPSLYSPTWDLKMSQIAISYCIIVYIVTVSHTDQ